MEISDDLLEINPNLQSQVAYVCKERHKAVLVDNFYKDLKKIHQATAKLSYTDHYDLTGNFPGARAQINISTQLVIDAISELWGSQLYPFFKPQLAVFQALTTKDYRLNIGQRAPHIDPDITALIYLNPEHSCSGGTALYRHRPTGLERLPRLPITPDQEVWQLAERLELRNESC